MTDRMQQLMDQAYDRWWFHFSLSKQDFWDQLSADERFAVFIGNMNYQVENGGFVQWWGNHYATEETVSYIQWACSQIDTPAARRVAELVAEFWAMAKIDVTDDEEWDACLTREDELCQIYYSINQQFLADAEAHLNRE